MIHLIVFFRFLLVVGLIHKLYAYFISIPYIDILLVSIIKTRRAPAPAVEQHASLRTIFTQTIQTKRFKL